MAIITGSIERVLLKYPNLDINKITFIGWGAGQYFRYQYPLLRNNIKLKYTVCPNQENHGKIIEGVEVRSPESLHSENPEHTVVVIFSERYFDIMHALRDEFSDIPSINACTMDDEEDLLSEMDDFRQLNLTPLGRAWKSKPRFGIFIQGIAMAHTPYVLAWNRLHHPHAYQCMVTWDHLDRELLNQCAPWLDKLILVPQPEHMGRLYFNAALRSARKGVEHLAEQGIEYAIRCRSDNILAGSLNKVIERHFSRDRNIGKIAISIKGWPHLPFMFSEKCMISRTTDMLRLWSMAEDPKDTNHLDYQLTSDDHFLKLMNTVPEVFLWSNYARNLGHPVHTFEDSQNFQRARLLPLEPDLHWHSLKFTPLFHISSYRNLWCDMNQWQSVFNNPENAREHARALQSLDISVGDFWQRKIG